MAKTPLASQPTPHVLVPADSVTTAPGARTCIISSEIGAADRQAVLDLFTRSSPDTRRDRFHGALSVFPQRYLEEIISGRQLAVVARDTCDEESREKVFGLASAASIEPGIAEFAVWVEDACQGRGVGSLLGRAILRLLAQHGTCTAIGIMEPDNLAIRRLVSRIAPGAATRSEDGMIVVSIPLKDLAAEPEAA
ncbi:MAG: GNAT family N-acetyltransferase [Streptosporangiaceae bacterium]